MRSVLTTLVTAAAFTLGGSALAAEEGLAEMVQEGCKTELETYCTDVTPGEGRVLSCLYARNDKLSGRCEHALYEAAVRLERAVAALTYVAKECDDDADKFCAKVEAGEGRIIDCLVGKSAELAPTCKTALTDVGLME